MRPLEKRIWDWMYDILSEPHEQFNNLPICPFIHKYHEDIIVKQVDDDLIKTLDHYVLLFRPLKYKALVLAFPNKDIKEIEKAVEAVLNRPENDDLEMLINNHQLKGTIRGVYTGFSECDLVIIQDKSTLTQARSEAKEMGYYDR